MTKTIQLCFAAFAILTLIFPSLLFAQSANEQRLKLAESFEKSGDMQNASAIYMELSKASPSNDTYFAAAVRTFKAISKFSDLIPLVEKRIAAKDNAYTEAVYGELLWRLGKVDSAVNAWNSALDKCGKDPANYVTVAETQISVRRLDKAIATLESGRKNVGNDELFIEDLARLYTATGNMQLASDEAFKLYDRTANLPLMESMLRELFSSKETLKSIKERIDSRAGDQNIAMLRLKLWFSTETKDYNAALETADRLDKLQNSQGAEIYLFAENARKDGLIDPAVRGFNMLIDKGRNCPYVSNALFGLAQVLEQKIETDTSVNNDFITEVIARYKKIASDFPGTTVADDCIFRIAALYAEKLHRPDVALSEITPLLSSRNFTPGNARAGLYAGSLMTILGRYKEALETFRLTENKYVKSYPTVRDEADFKAAELRWYLGDIDSAKSLFAKLSSSGVSDIANKSIRKVILIEQNKDYNSALSKYASAEMHELKNMPDSAKLEYEYIIATASDADIGEQAFLQIARLEYERKRYDSSKVIAEKLIKTIPETIHGDEAMIIIGDSYDKAGRKDDAVKTYSDILTLYPRSIYLPQIREKIRKLRGEKA